MTRHVAFLTALLLAGCSSGQELTTGPTLFSEPVIAAPPASSPQAVATAVEETPAPEPSEPSTPAPAPAPTSTPSAPAATALCSDYQYQLPCPPPNTQCLNITGDLRLDVYPLTAFIAQNTVDALGELTFNGPMPRKVARQSTDFVYQLGAIAVYPYGPPELGCHFDTARIWNVTIPAKQ